MNYESEYQAALDYLYSFVDYSLQRSVRYSPDKFDLARMHQLMASLGNPHQHYPVIHIAGTKGKGSASALCASALKAAGYHVGVYTSPHLIDYNERIQIDGQAIPHSDLAALVETVKPQVAAIPRLTTFEITTAIAFLYFSLKKVEAAVIEVGLGGRLDATNVVTPIVSVITSLSYDHTNLLGNTLTEIAAEKAGIIKPGIPVVLAPQKEEARQTVMHIARERSSRLIQVGVDYEYQALSHSLDGQSFQVCKKSAQARGDGASEPAPVRLTIPLLGYHQVENGVTAYTALQVAREMGLEISETAIQEGFACVSWPGRFEVLRRKPPVVVDSAHNRDSAMRLRQALEDYFPGYPVILVFGASEDKDITGMLAELLPYVDRMIVSKSFHPRAIEPEKLVELALPYKRRVQVTAHVKEAFKEALKIAGDESLVLATGSIFVVAEVREAWQERLKVINGS